MIDVSELTDLDRASFVSGIGRSNQLIALNRTFVRKPCAAADRPDVLDGRANIIRYFAAYRQAFTVTDSATVGQSACDRHIGLVLGTVKLAC